MIALERYIEVVSLQYVPEGDCSRQLNQLCGSRDYWESIFIELDQIFCQVAKLKRFFSTAEYVKGICESSTNKARSEAYVYTHLLFIHKVIDSFEINTIFWVISWLNFYRFK